MRFDLRLFGWSMARLKPPKNNALMEFDELFGIHTELESVSKHHPRDIRGWGYGAGFTARIPPHTLTLTLEIIYD
jgi:hypothetical protein